MSQPIPPLPRGFVLENQPAKAPPLPAGFVMEPAGAAQVAPAAAGLPTTPSGPSVGPIDDGILDQLGRAFGVLTGDSMAGTPIARIEEAGGIVRDALIPDALQRGWQSMKRNTAGTIDALAGPSEDSIAHRAQLARQREAYGADLDDLASIQAMSDAQSLGQFFDAVKANPSAIGEVIGESFGQQALPLATMALSLPVGLAAGGASSFEAERQGAIDEAMMAAGVDLTDPVAVGQFLASRPDLVAEAERRGMVRGGIVGAADVVTGGLAGRFAAGTGATRALTRAGADAVLGVGGGAGGEAAAQLATDGEVTRLGDVFLEGAAEGPTTVAEGIASVVREARAQPRQAAAAPPPIPAEPDADPLPAEPVQPRAAQAAPVPPRAPEPAATPEADEAAANDIMDALVAAGLVPPPVPEQGGNPEPVAPAAGSQPAAAVPDLAEQFAMAERPQEVQAVTGRAAPAAAPAPVTMQNRDRSRAASVAQMQAIRKAPDPERLTFSRDPNSGAPMVGEGRPVPAADRGRTDTVIMASGRRVPVTYAVVEAGEIAASHDADGRANPEYGVSPLRALNNGRAAGLQAAHAAGNAAGYVDGLVADADVHGVSEAAIRAKRQPVLVRLYDPSVNTGDMGAESNASAQLGLSPVEQAQTDARALPDMSGLEWSEDGSLSTTGNAAFYRAWFKALGDTAAASLQDANGRPNAAAVLRIRSAMAQRAYGDDALLTALAEEVNPDNRNVLNAMVQAAPAFAALEDGGVLTDDIRASVSGAFSLLRDAASRGLSVSDLIAQSDMFGRDPAADAIALFMANNARSAKRMADAFKALAAYADAGQRAQAVVDMFGTAETPSILGAIEAANAALEESYGPQFRIETGRLERGARREPAEPGRGSGERDAGGRAAADTSEAQQPDAASQRRAAGDLFAAPTAREQVADAQRRRDAERDGRTGTGRTDMLAGDGELFAGPRPDQGRIEDEINFDSVGEGSRPDGSAPFQRRDAANASGLPAGLPASTTTAAGALARKLNAERQRRGESGELRFAEVPASALPDDARRALTALGEATGTRVVVVRNLTPEVDAFNGVTFRDGVLYVDEAADRPLVLAAAHEWVHQLRRDDPAAYQRLEDEVRRQGNLPAWIERMAAEGNRTDEAGATEELTADAVADAMIDPDFLRRIVEEGGALRRAARSFLQFLDNMLARARGRNTGAYLADVRAFRDELAAVLRDFRPRFEAPTDADLAADEAGQQPEFLRRGQRTPINTPAFRLWFRDSKAINADGSPLIVYHGTGEEFDAFDRGRLASATGHASSGLGFFFTPDKAGAQAYADKASDFVPANAVVLETYLSIQNPYVMSLEEAQSFEDAAEASIVRMQLERQGYDGVHIPEQNAWVAFRANQVKRTDNLGAWSPSDDRMMFQRRAAVDDRLAEAYNDYESGARMMTARDLLVEVQGIIRDSDTVPQSVIDAAEAYAQEIEDNDRLYGGRGDDGAEDRFVDALAAAASPAFMRRGSASGDLFAGPRPEQDDIETGELPAQDVSTYGEARPLPTVRERGATEPTGGAAPGRRGRAQLRGQLDLFVATRGNAAPDAGNEPAVRVDRPKLANAVGLAQIGQFRSGVERVRSMADAAHILAPLRKSPQEKLMVLALDADGRPLTVLQHTVGLIAESIVDPATVLGAMAAVPGIRSVVFAHNHPSGNPDASNADRNLDMILTRLFEGSGIEVRGSIIVQPGRRTFTAYGNANGPAGFVTNDNRITTARRRGAVDVTERRLRRVAPVGREKLSSSQQAKDMVRAALADTPAGVIMLDQQHGIIGTMPFDPRATAKLRTGDVRTSHARYIADAIGANAPAVIVYGPKADEDAVKNLGAAYARSGIRLLDVMLAGRGSTIDSLAEKGGLPHSNSPMFQRRSVPQARAEAAAKRATADTALGNPINGGALGWNPKAAKWEGVRATMRKARVVAQDAFIALRDTQQDIEAATGRPLEDLQNVCQLENLMHGRIQAGVEALDDQHFGPLFDAMRKAGVTVKQLEDYHEARHAPERNREIAKINPNMPDGGSGMTTADARKALAGMDHAKLEPLARRVDAIVKETRKRMLDAGVITQQVYDALEAQYQYYVPLRGKDESKSMQEQARAGFGGGGLDIRTSGLKGALGRGAGNRATNILGEVIGDAQRAVIAAERARVGRGLARLVLANPNPSFWQMEAVRTEQAKDSQGQVYQRLMNESLQPDVVHVMIKGVPYRIQFKDPNLAAALRNIGGTGKLLTLPVFRQIATFQRYIAATLTAWNPGFVATNMARDLQFGLARIASEHGLPNAGLALARYPLAIRAMWRLERKKGARPGNKMDAYAREFEGVGGKTGWMHVASGDALSSAAMWRSSGSPLASGRRAGAAILKAIEDLNDTFENAMRLSYYAGLRDAGLTPQQAGQKTKDLTVNFNRKGTAGPALSAGYLFFNAAVQGTHALGRAVDPRRPHGRKIIAGLGGLATLQFFLAAMASGMEDEDGEDYASKVPEWIKERNLWWVGSDGQVYTIPMPFGFNIATYAGSRFHKLFSSDAENVASGAKSAGSVAGAMIGDLTRVAVSAVFPVQVAHSGVAAFIPTEIGQHIVQQTANKNDFGRQIWTENTFDRITPRAVLGRDATPEGYKVIATALNRLGGGDDYTKPIALLDIAPEQIQFSMSLLTGGTGNWFGGAAQTAFNAAFDPEANEQRPTPLLQTFTRPLNDVQVTAAKFYERREAIEIAADRIRDMAERDGIDAAREYADSLPFMAGVAIKLTKGGEAQIRPGNSAVYSAFKDAEKAGEVFRDDRRQAYATDSSMFSAERSKALREASQRQMKAQKELLREWNAATESIID